MMKKRAQGWGLDVAIALVIFFTGIVAFLYYSFNYNSGSEEKFNDMKYEGEAITDSLLSQGFPAEWYKDISKAISIGLTTDNKINETKLSKLFEQINLGNYSKTKSLLNTKYDYYFNFSEPMMIGPGNSYVAGIGKNITNYSDLVKITRFTVYKNKPVSLKLYVWK
jgi:hypothetical protein